MTDFHFIRPWWLAALILVVIAIYLLKKLRISQSGWHNIIPDHLANLLLTTQNKTSKQQGSLALVIPTLIGVLTVIALAGPTWQKQPQPVFKVAQGSVLVMDMSYSMYATDLSPNRLTRARYKAIDLLNSLNEGEMGLIAYAGDAFTISPLTEDINNIKLLLPSLTPDIMPVLGSNPLAALTLADKMLKNAGHLKGDIYWFTDGIDKQDIEDIHQWAKQHSHNLHVLAIGTENAAPIKLPSGELLKDNSGNIVIPHLTTAALQGVARDYQVIRNDNKDIEGLMAHNLLAQEKNAVDKQQKTEDDNNHFGDQWQEAGPYLLLIILPLLLAYFRRGVLVAIIPLSLLIISPPPAQASLWQDLWKTKDQQGQQAFNNKQYQQAAKSFKNPLWQGSAYYKAGDYEQALKAFQQQDSAEALYNQGNALAKLQRLDQAIEAYKKALAKNPALEDAKKNKKILEELKKQQQQNKQQGDQKNKDQQSKHDQNKNNQSKDQGKNQNQQGSDQQNQQTQQKNQQQQQNEQQQSSDNKQNTNDQKNNAQKAKNQSKEKSKENSQKDAAKQQQEKAKKSKDNKADDQQKQRKQAQAQQAKNKYKNKDNAAQTKAQLAKQQHDKEMKKKYQQLMNKVTDDPYLLLRNKMQLEYQKRRGETRTRGATKQW